MDLLGEFLKKKREERGKTLEEVAEATKININYLKALEEGNFNSLPGEVFVKGFLRHYARYLGIEEEEILNRYHQEKGAGDIPLKLNTNKFYAPEEEIKKINLKNWLIPLVVIIFISIIFIYRTKEKPPEPETFYTQDTFENQPTIQDIEQPPYPQIEQPSQETPLRPTKPTLVRPDVNPKKGAISVEGKTTTSPGPEDNTIVLNIFARETSWVLAYIDDNRIKDVLLQPGEKVSWKANQRFLLTLGNAGGVEIEFNGRPLEPFGPPGVVVKDIVLSRSEIRKGQVATEGR